jgi:ATP-binding cassette subfamily B protein
MKDLMDGRTSFVVAHRLSTIKEVDLILVMKDGNIIEQGSHTELLTRGGFYSELFESQFSH